MEVLRKIIFFVAVFSIFCSCERKEGEKTLPPVLDIPVKKFDYKTSQTFVYVKAKGEWQLSIDFAGAEPWARFDRSSGTGDVSGIVLTLDKNSTGELRNAVVSLVSGSFTVKEEIRQNKFSEDPGIVTELKPDPIPGWLELPETNNKKLYYFNHPMILANGSKSRNYSFYLDPQAKISVWVAYPMNKSLIGSPMKRTDAWGIDPKVPRIYQSEIFRAYGNSKIYSRGHQIASADRLKQGESKAANVQTFYGTNMTPQRHNFNGEIWAKLEEMVREWSRQFDTLYVVTGAVAEGSTKTVKDNAGKDITVPVAYYKALLGYKINKTIGITGTTGGYTAIGFYFEHKDDYPNSSEEIFAHSLTIDALEEKLGYDLFVNLPAKIGETLSNKVESAKDSYWTK